MPALGGTLADDIQHLLHVEIGAQAEGNGFRQGLHQTGHADLVDHLCQLAAAAFTHIGKGARERIGHGCDLIKHRLIAAAHDGELAVDGSSLTTRDRRIDKVQAALLRFGIELACDLSGGCGVVYKDGAGLHARKSAIVAQHNGAQVVVIAHAAEHHARAFDGFARRGSLMAAGEFLNPGLSLGGCAVVGCDLMARHGQMPRHGVAHDAQAQKCDLGGGRWVVAAGSDGGGHEKSLNTWRLGEPVAHRTARGLEVRLGPQQGPPSSKGCPEARSASGGYTIVRCSVPAARSSVRARWLFSLICRRKSLTESALRSASS